jgi:2-oxoglutarate ferredoxin oxidoreductase subunit gamma
LATEVIVAGIGGQGGQLLAKCLAAAAALEDSEAFLTSEVGGEMRGGHSLATVALGPGATRTLPVIPEVDAAIVLSPALWPQVAAVLRPGGLLVLDSTLGPWDRVPAGVEALDVPATRLAREVDAPLGAGFVLLAAYNAQSGQVSLDSLIAAMRPMVPSYRTQHLEANERALRSGAAFLLAGSAAATARSSQWS